MLLAASEWRWPEPSRGAINEWVSLRTEKLIPELLQKGTINALTRFVLTNTVYFDASWKTKFEKGATYPALFSRADGSKVDVDTMHAGMDLPYARGSNYRAVALPYASEELSLIAVLPDEGKLGEVAAGLSVAWFDALRAELAPTSVQLSFPKIDYEQQASLKPMLTTLGMRAAFDDRADFTGMSTGSLTMRRPPSGHQSVRGRYHRRRGNGRGRSHPLGAAVRPDAEPRPAVPVRHRRHADRAGAVPRARIGSERELRSQQNTAADEDERSGGGVRAGDDYAVITMQRTFRTSSA